MALESNQRGPRKCLRCGEQFDSRNAGNRICPKCDRLNSREYQPHMISSTVYTEGGVSSLPSEE
jgi:predicted  nucleic acid-binding Zn-ribbon protein